MARNAGYQSINFDLIYGLPFQITESIRRTILECISLKPDRIAYYSYAHVPWTSRGQRLFDEQDLPSAEEKMKLYQTGKELFSGHGYADIGMDHFALPEDELYVARQQGNLHRNFMGYTIQHTSLLLGLGVSAISDAGTAFAQNSKSLHDYYRSINGGKTAIEKGYFMSGEDAVFRRYIHDISCRGKTFFVPAYRQMLEAYSFPELAKLKADGLVDFDKNQITVAPEGRSLIRNICRAFDLHLLKNKETAGNPLYSKAI
jgi:oxygen-independent coproporphyrinogen-3 oxidase